MKVKFNSQGNLHATVAMTYAEFSEAFGFNEYRKKKIEQALVIIKIFRSLGCKRVLVTGSFLSKKEEPNDIDLCLDETGIDYLKMLRDYPQYLEPKGIAEIKKNYQCDLAVIFKPTVEDHLKIFKTDRQGHARGFIELDLTGKEYD